MKRHKLIISPHRFSRRPLRDPSAIHNLCTPTPMMMKNFFAVRRLPRQTTEKRKLEKFCLSPWGQSDGSLMHNVTSVDGSLTLNFNVNKSIKTTYWRAFKELYCLENIFRSRAFELLLLYNFRSIRTTRQRMDLQLALHVHIMVNFVGIRSMAFENVTRMENFSFRRENAVAKIAQKP